MADSSIAYGLAKGLGIDTSGMSPSEVWEALKSKGVTPENANREKLRQDNEKREKIARKYNTDQDTNISLAPQKVNLTKKEWALWYKTIGEIKNGAYVGKMSNGNKLIRIEYYDKANDKGVFSIVITGGTFERPKAIQRLNFLNDEELDRALDRLKDGR